MICTWCIAILGNPATQVSIKRTGVSALMSGPADRDVQWAATARKLELITEAFEQDWEVWVNGGSFRMEPAVTTWHGDPACAVHLHEQISRDESPQTVRMAQWRR